MDTVSLENSLEQILSLLGEPDKDGAFIFHVGVLWGEIRENFGEEWDRVVDEKMIALQELFGSLRESMGLTAMFGSGGHRKVKEAWTAGLDSLVDCFEDLLDEQRYG